MSRKTLGVLLIITISLAFSCGEGREIDLRQKCEDLEIGMTRAEVEAIMGKPSGIIQREFRGRAEEKLCFPSPRLASEKTSCVIDKETGLVIEVRCGEGYRLTQEEAQCGKLRIHMTRGEVIEIMGEPSFKFVSEPEEWLYYVSPRYPQRVTKCVIDKKTGLLTATFCH